METTLLISVSVNVPSLSTSFKQNHTELVFLVTGLFHIHVLTSIRISCENNNTVCIHLLFTQSPSDGQTGSFRFGAIVNVSMNMNIQKCSLKMWLSMFLSIDLEEEC